MSETHEKPWCWPWAHKWTKWAQYDWRGRVFGTRLAPLQTEGAPISERRQRRHCTRCGYEQDMLVRNG